MKKILHNYANLLVSATFNLLHITTPVASTLARKIGLMLLYAVAVVVFFWLFIKVPIFNYLTCVSLFIIMGFFLLLIPLSVLIVVSCLVWDYLLPNWIQNPITDTWLRLSKKIQKLLRNNLILTAKFP